MAQETLLGPKGTPLRRDRQKPVTDKRLREALTHLKTTPRKIGDGPASFSISTTVEIQPFKWDTNSFYRRLNLDPDCERIEIAAAFHNAPRPTHAADLHYSTAAKNLLKKDVRRRYDAVPLGAFFADDPALDAARCPVDMESPLEGMTRTEWAVYADPCVSDADVEEWDPTALRTGIIEVLSNWGKRFSDPQVGLGLTRTNPRWEMMGNFPVLFIGVDMSVTREYLVRVANVFMAATAPH